MTTITASAPAGPRPFSEFVGLAADEIRERTWAARRMLGKRVVILGHHYQRESIIEFADLRGDSLKLSQLAAAQADAEFIVFCGVHFMAESADVLRRPHQTVILPDLKAGCSMADMADLEHVEEAWERLTRASRRDDRAGDLHELDRRAEGILRAKRWHRLHVEQRAAGPRVGVGAEGTGALLPRPAPRPQHRVRDGAAARPHGRVGIPRARSRSHQRALLRASTKLMLWRGWCSVHTKFHPSQIAEVRAADPNVKVLVHPECPFDVVRGADLVGSTEFIIEQVAKAPAGSHWAIGTEINLVHRLALQHPEQNIHSLQKNVCPCATMNRIDPAHLLWVLENLVAGHVVNAIHVPESDRADAKVALDRMLALARGGAPMTGD